MNNVKELKQGIYPRAYYIVLESLSEDDRFIINRQKYEIDITEGDLIILKPYN